MLTIYALAQREDVTEFRPLLVPVTRILDDGTTPQWLVHDCASPGWLVALYAPSGPPGKLTLMGEPVFAQYGGAEAHLRTLHRRRLHDLGLKPDREEPSAAAIYATQQADRKPPERERIG
jgi:hypothetical protein